MKQQSVANNVGTKNIGRDAQLITDATQVVVVKVKVIIKTTAMVNIDIDMAKRPWSIFLMESYAIIEYSQLLWKIQCFFNVLNYKVGLYVFPGHGNGGSRLIWFCQSKESNELMMLGY
jgi:hypothetical protein